VWPILIAVVVMMLHKPLREFATQMARRVPNVTEVSFAGATAKFETNITKAVDVKPAEPDTLAQPQREGLVRLFRRLKQEQYYGFPKPPAKPDLTRSSWHQRRSNRKLSVDGALAAKMFTVEVGDYLHRIATEIYDASIDGQDVTSLLAAISRTPLAQPHWTFLVEASLLLPFDIRTEPMDTLMSRSLDDVDSLLVQIADLCQASMQLAQVTIDEAIAAAVAVHEKT
jgi:hypothetical protein